MAPAERAASPRDWLVLIACLVCQIGMGVGGYALAVFLKPVVTELGWTRAEYASAQSVMSTAVAIAGPAVGWFAARAGARPVLALGATALSAALYAGGSITSLGGLYATGVGIGFAVACLGDLPTGAAIADRFRGRQGFALGLVYIGSNLGGGLVPLVATALSQTGSWRTALHAIGGCAWLVLLPTALLVSPPPRRASTEATPERPAPGDANDELAPAASLGQAVRARDFWLLAWALIVFYSYRLGMNVHLVAFLSDLGYSNAEAASGFSAMLLLGVLAKVSVGALADRLGAGVAAIGDFGMLLLASLLLVLPMTAWAAPLFLALHGFATAAEDVVVPLLIARRFGPATVARLYGILLLALVPGGWLGPVLAGWIFDRTGAYRAVFALFATANLTALIAIATVSRSTLGAGEQQGGNQGESE